MGVEGVGEREAEEGASEGCSFQGHEKGREVVDVGVGVGGRELAVTDERIVEFDLGDVARADERERGAFAVDERDEEIVDADEPSVHLAGVGRDGDGRRGDVGSASAATGHESGLLQLVGVGDASSGAVEIGVAIRAGFGERGGADGWVAGNDGGRGHAGEVVLKLWIKAAMPEICVEAGRKRGGVLRGTRPHGGSEK